MSVSSVLKPVLMATTFGALLALPAAAQERYDNAAYTAPSQEEVIVTAPDFSAERHTLGLPGKVSLSRQVSYSDLDLSTHDGARTLRDRVRDTAREVCQQLRDTYPLHQQPLATRCYEGALKDAMVRADSAIREARYDR